MASLLMFVILCLSIRATLSSESAHRKCPLPKEQHLTRDNVPIMKPRHPSIPLEYFPGESICVSCNFFGGLLVLALELALTYGLLTRFVSAVLTPAPPAPEVTHPFGHLRHVDHAMRFGHLGHVDPALRRIPEIDNGGEGPEPDNVARVYTCFTFLSLGGVLSVLGWMYYATIVLTFVNFISWLFFCGLFLVGPGLLCTLLTSAQSHLFWRRVKLAGWFLGFLAFALFPNILLLPQQIERRFDPSNTVLLPDSPEIAKLSELFFQDISKQKFETMHFYDQMYTVDKFIAKVIVWKQDYGQYGLTGLLLSPIEVVGRMSGDCQGQASVTASLLISLGFNAYVVETPFHWWTHAEDPRSGLVAHLNSHGGGGMDGNVRPQPIVLIYTRPRAQCTNCSYNDANNHEPLYYAANPFRAFAVAATGAHIFRRNAFTITEKNPLVLVLYGLLFGLVVALYCTYYLDDFQSYQDSNAVNRFFKRLIVASIICVFPLMFGMAIWATLYYPITIIHGFGFISFALTYISSDSFNELL